MPDDAGNTISQRIKLLKTHRRKKRLQANASPTSRSLKPTDARRRLRQCKYRRHFGDASIVEIIDEADVWFFTNQN